VPYACSAIALCQRRTSSCAPTASGLCLARPAFSASTAQNFSPSLRRFLSRSCRSLAISGLPSCGSTLRDNLRISQESAPATCLSVANSTALLCCTLSRSTALLLSFDKPPAQRAVDGNFDNGYAGNRVRHAPSVRSRISRISGDRATHRSQAGLAHHAVDLLVILAQ
jgi:hypothetical protein